jgi:fumarylpyruvate hydrolase
MILELADIRIQPGQNAAFEAAIQRGLDTVISRARGFQGFKVNHSLESPQRYALQIFWDTLEDHTVGFRQSPAFAEWRSIVGPFFDGAPTVEHFDLVTKSLEQGYVVNPGPAVSVPVVGGPARFPVHRVYCVGRNYEEHAKEMGFTGREPPFFFLKPADSVVVVNAGSTGTLPYPTLTQNFHHEIELVVAIGTGGRNIKAADAHQHIFGYAVGLDMTRRDLQNDMKKQGRPWCIGKAFDHSAPIGPITPAAAAGDVANAEIFLQVNGQDRQRSQVTKLIWNIGETIEHLSAAWELQPGDLIYTGTPEGVAAVVAGDTLYGSVAGLEPLRMTVK